MSRRGILKMPLAADEADGTAAVVTASKTQPLRICVFCSATTGTGEAHLAAARLLAQSLAAHRAELIYGGGTTGLMGEIAKTLVSLKGPESVHGIIPHGVLGLERPGDAVSKTAAGNKGNEARKRTWKDKLGLVPGASENKPIKNATSGSTLLSEHIYGRTTVAEDMPARKRIMCQLVNEGGPGSGFIALSGGFGTMDELIEMVTLRQFGVHQKKVCLLNVEGFWDPLLVWMDLAIDKGFVRPEAKDTMATKETAEDCIDWLKES